MKNFRRNKHSCPTTESLPLTLQNKVVEILGKDHMEIFLDPDYRVALRSLLNLLLLLKVHLTLI